MSNISQDQPRTRTQQFASKGQSAPLPEQTLTPFYLGLEPSDHRVNDGFPIPQANSLVKLSSVVDHLRDGNDTGVAMARALDVSERQGYYYADAAGYLGLVDVTQADEIRTYVLTPLGVELLNMNGTERRTLLRHLVAGMPSVKVLKDQGEDSMLEALANEGLGEGTVDRRGATITSWVDALEQEPDLNASIDMELTNSGVRSRDSAQLAVLERQDAIVARAASLPRPEEFCTDCFMAKSTSGLCGC